MYLYIFPLVDKSAFKIGQTRIPMRRITRLFNFYDVDVSSITIVQCNTNFESEKFEALLHSLLGQYRVRLPYEGGTEFFKYAVYKEALEFCQLVCKLNGYLKVQFEKDASLKPLCSVDIEKNRFAELVRRKRLELNISQLELAKAAKVGARTIERFETSGQATFENVIKIFSVLGIECATPKEPTTFGRRVKRKILVGDSDHEPDKEWEREI